MTPTNHDRLRDTLRAIHDQLTTAEAGAIVDLSRLAAQADGKTNVDEMLVLTAIAKIVYEMAGVTTIPLASGSVDGQRLLEIGETLVPIQARELAFASAFLVMIEDLDLTKEEKELGDRLAEALLLEHDRARALAANMETFARAVRA